jgi:L-cystine transport system permease protein
MEGPMTLFDIPFFLHSIPDLLRHLPISLFVAIFSFVAAVLLGLFTALFKMYRVPVLRQIAAIYISVIRGTPMLVQLLLICYGIPKTLYFLKVQYGIFQNFDPNGISSIYYAIITFTINLGAYLAETIRSSLEAVGVGQFEAAQSVGMNYRQTMIRIIIPQAFNVALPNLGNGIISTVKDTSFIFIIGIVDIMGEAKIIGARAMAYMEVYVATALIYWCICIFLERLFAYLEKRVKRYERPIV